MNAENPATNGDMPLAARPSAPTVQTMTTAHQAISKTNAPKFNPEQIAEARTQIKRAFELAGFVDEHGAAICPTCGKTGQSRLKFFPAGAYQCFSGEWCNSGDNAAVSLLVDNGWRFADAVAALLGMPHNHQSETPVRSVLNEVNGFQAVVDSDVYEAIVHLGDEQAAIEYFARWHISPEAVQELGTSVITDAPAMRKALLAKFGKERLVNAGVVRPGTEGRRDYWVINNNYPVLEPHRNAEGRIVGLQARASREREARYNKHVLYSALKREAEAAGTPFRDPNVDETYVGKFSSLRGGQVGQHLVGGGIPRLASLELGSTIYVVEGIKDLLAMRTLGFEAIALPGVGVAPNADVIAMLARHHIQLCFDADEGGDTGTRRLAETLAKSGIIFNELGVEWATQHPSLQGVDLAQQGLMELGVDKDSAAYPLRVVSARLKHGFRCKRKRPPEGMDIADVLVSKVAVTGCSCDTCNKWRNEH